ncbi:sporulation histidine kinase inhibitor Sda [Niallia sp. Krafla_26]
MKGLGILSDFELVEVYEKAIAMNLDEDFTRILLIELDRRGIRNLEATIC